MTTIKYLKHPRSINSSCLKKNSQELWSPRGHDLLKLYSVKFGATGRVKHPLKITINEGVAGTTLYTCA